VNITKITTAAFCTALTALLAQVAIPLPFSPVPFTGQVVGILLTAALLGPKTGLLSTAAYLLLGAAGVPVFSLARGGMAIITGPTGGYLWGFLPAVLIAGVLLNKQPENNLFINALSLLPAMLVVYCCGALQLGFLMQYSIKQTIIVGVAPFIFFDLLKIFIAAYFSLEIKKSLRRNGLAHLLGN
jgi:biotin transport system substrate-specific component